MKRLALKVLIASVAVSAVLGVYALLVGDFGEVEVRILLTSLSISGVSILAMACGVAWERRRLGALPPAGAVLAVLTGAFLLIGIWGELSDEHFWKSTASLAILAGACAHAALMSLGSLAPRFQWCRVAAYVLAFLLAGMLIAALWAEWDDEGLWRWIGALSVLLSAATIAVPVFHRMSGMDPAVARAPALRFCPSCTCPVPDTAAAGRPTRCSGCGVEFVVQFSD